MVSLAVTKFPFENTLEAIADKKKKKKSPVKLLKLKPFEGQTWPCQKWVKCGVTRKVKAISKSLKNEHFHIKRESFTTLIYY